MPTAKLMHENVFAGKSNVLLPSVEQNAVKNQGATHQGLCWHQTSGGTLLPCPQCVPKRKQQKQWKSTYPCVLRVGRISRGNVGTECEE